MIADPVDVVRGKRQGSSVLLDLTTRDSVMSTGVAMTEAFIRDNRETALKFPRGVVEAAHYYKTHPEQSVQIVAAHLKTTDFDMVCQAGRYFAERLISRKPFPTIEDIQLTIQKVPTQNSAAKNIPPDRFIDSSLMEEINRSGLYRSTLPVDRKRMKIVSLPVASSVAHRFEQPFRGKFFSHSPCFCQSINFCGKDSELESDGSMVVEKRDLGIV